MTRVGRHRHLTTTALVLLAAAASSGCEWPMVDTPLEVTADERAAVPGEPITGAVQNPDGDITVTLTAAETPLPPSGSNSTNAIRCDYDDARYSCPTTGLSEGRYRVEVTDARYPSEGTRTVAVVLTDVSGYDPDAQLGDQPNTVLLTGWAPGRPVTLKVIDAHLNRQLSGPVTGTPDRDGRLTLSIPELVPDTTYVVDATDGLWSTLDADGWDRVFIEVDE